MKTREELENYLFELMRLQQEGINVDSAITATLDGLPEDEASLANCFDSIVGRHLDFVGQEEHKPKSQANPTDIVFRAAQAKEAT